MKNLSTLLLWILLLAQSPLMAWSASSNPDFEAGVRLYNARRFEDAVGYFHKVTVTQPNFGPAYYYGANCYYQLGRNPEAVRLYWFVCRNFPQSTEAKTAFSFLQKIDSNFAKNAKDPDAGELPTLTTQPGGTLKPIAKPVQTAAKAARENPAKPTVIRDASPPELVVPYSCDRGSRVVVSARMNGKPLYMMLDTGAEKCFINDWQLQDLGIKSESVGYRGEMTGTGGTIRTTSMLVTLEVGGLSRQVPIHVEYTPQRPPADDYPLLGEDFFKDYIYEIDTQKQVVRFKKHIARDSISPDKLAAQSDSNAVPFERRGNLMIVTAEVNGREIPMIFDSGATTVAFSDTQFAHTGLRIPADADEGLSYGVGGSRRSRSFEVDRISLGPIEKRNVRVSVSFGSPMSHPLLGQTFLHGLKYTIDPKENVIRFEK